MRLGPAGIAEGEIFILDAQQYIFVGVAFLKSRPKINGQAITRHLVVGVKHVNIGIRVDRHSLAMLAEQTANEAFAAMPAQGALAHMGEFFKIAQPHSLA